MIDPTARLTAERGHNLVIGAPPSPAMLAPILAGAAERLAASEGPPILGLVPMESVTEWARIGAHAAGPAGGGVAGTASAGRLARILGDSTRRLVFTSPAAALDLVRKAALDPAGVAGFLVLFPEAWGPEGDEQLTAMFQDIPRETQRIIVTSDPERIGPLVERYAWRAPIHDVLAQVPAGAAPAVRVTPASWAGRIEAVREVVEQLDPESLAVWTASELDHEPLGRALAGTGARASVTTQVPVGFPLIIGYDLPTPAILSELGASGEVVLLAPPGTEAYVARLAPNRKPLHPRGALERARTAADRVRARIVDAMDRPAEAELSMLAPLFERFEATRVAAALLGLWQESQSRVIPDPAAQRIASPVRLWVSAGKKDGTTPSDLVAVLVRECEVPREAIGKIDIRETFSLVEIAPAAGPEQVAERLTGKSIRKRRLIARLDRPSAAVERVAQRLPRTKDRRRT